MVLLIFSTFESILQQCLASAEEKWKIQKTKQVQQSRKEKPLASGKVGLM